MFDSFSCYHLNYDAVIYTGNDSVNLRLDKVLRVFIAVSNAVSGCLHYLIIIVPLKNLSLFSFNKRSLHGKGRQPPCSLDAIKNQYIGGSNYTRRKSITSRRKT